MGINLTRIQKFIDDLSDIGRSTGGGITRLSFSDEFMQAQVLVSSYMEEAGMEVTIDAGGNLIGSFTGRDADLPAVMTGSHLDTVPNGGAFDGALGIATAVECIRTWYEDGWRPHRTVKVIATIEEEGTRFGLSCFGSRVMLGEFSSQSPTQIIDDYGYSLAQFLEQRGLSVDPFSRVEQHYKMRTVLLNFI